MLIHRSIRSPSAANKHLAVHVIDLEFPGTQHPLLPQVIRTLYLRWKMVMMDIYIHMYSIQYTYIYIYYVDIVSTAHFENSGGKKMNASSTTPG